MLSLENDLVKIVVSPLGAELCSIYHKKNKLEYMWQAGTEWPKHSPVLFPIVGQLKDNTYHYKNKTYTLPRHGFARVKNFSLIEQGPNRLVFRLSNDDTTYINYPFEFNFEIEYALRDDEVIITYVVENLNKHEMYFSVGAHPAFKIPLMQNEKYCDYKLQFDKNIDAEIWPLENGLIKDKSQPFFQNKIELDLDKSLFENDALVFKNFDSSSISLRSKNHEHGLKFNLNKAPYLGLWAAKNADFICIEPWYGIADSVNCNQDFISKEGINCLAEGDEFCYTFSVQVF